jgi:hypothetical protein
MARRSYGTGQLYVHTDAQGREIWYGRWYIGTKRIKRAIGPKRRPGTRDGLTRAQAEAELRRRMEATEAPTGTGAIDGGGGRAAHPKLSRRVSDRTRTGDHLDHN